MRIREATVDDAEALRVYATHLFAEGLPGILRRPAPSLEDEVEFVTGHLAGENSTLLVAEENGSIAGVIALRGKEHPQERHVGNVGVSVDREFRGRGVGTSLFAALFEWAAVHGVTRIELEAFTVNPGAIRLYERLGFEREGVRRGAFLVDGEYVDAVMLARGPSSTIAVPTSKEARP